MTFTITITSTEREYLRAETPAGPIEASTLGELGDRLKEVLLQLEAEFAAQERAELAQTSRSATDQAALLELARKSPPPDSWVEGEDD